ncbi:MAG TPA: hypothetical protein RMF84_02660 [Polyangiaceae bacterium LLY-WYZ-14_1]|nr:hypothetical protein [Polyangiaceae bacterium LLY-WYZ-14_1]
MSQRPPSSGEDRADAPEAGLPSGEERLWRALRARRTEERVAEAEAGLAAGELEPDVHFLLLRELYAAQLDREALADALDTARRMTEVGALRDLAHHDVARVLRGLDRRPEALPEQRLAARHAPPERRSFHLWTLAAWLQFAGEVDAALEAIDRASRWATRNRALVRAQDAWIRLDAGLPVADLDERIASLQRARSREGYGQYLLGMIARARGQEADSRALLRAFVDRVRRSDFRKRLTLQDELAEAEAALSG